MQSSEHFKHRLLSKVAMNLCLSQQICGSDQVRKPRGLCSLHHKQTHPLSSFPGVILPGHPEEDGRRNMEEQKGHLCPCSVLTGRLLGCADAQCYTLNLFLIAIFVSGKFSLQRDQKKLYKCFSIGDFLSHSPFTTPWIQTASQYGRFICLPSYCNQEL